MCAFTLAEVLITLVIIGVIAALTIPNLMQKYTEQTTVKKVQKFYSTLSNAYNLAMKDNGPVNDWGITGNNAESVEIIYEKLFKPYFKIAKNCGVNNTGNCISNGKYMALNNSSHSLYGATNTNNYKIALDDGSAVWCGALIVNTINESRIFVLYDINGAKPPNQFGKDTFEFTIIGNNLTPLGLKNSIAAFNTHCSDTTSDGAGCAAWVIYKGNMDYLHCNGLTWQSHSCKDK